MPGWSTVLRHRDGRDGLQVFTSPETGERGLGKCGVLNKELYFPARQNFNSCLNWLGNSSHLTLSLTNLLTDVNRDIQIKGLSLSKWRKISLFAKGTHQNNSSVPGTTDTARPASQPSVFGLALELKSVKREKMKKNNQTANKKSNAGTVRVVRTRLCCSWDFSAPIHVQRISLAKQAERREFSSTRVAHTPCMPHVQDCCLLCARTHTQDPTLGPAGKAPTGNYGFHFLFSQCQPDTFPGGTSWLPLVWQKSCPRNSEGWGRGAASDQDSGVLCAVLSDPLGTHEHCVEDHGQWEGQAKSSATASSISGGRT